MTLKGKVYFVILMPLEFIGLLLVLGFIATSSLQAADNTSEPETPLSGTGLEQHALTLVSVSPLIVEGTTLGELLVYDDPTTKRPADLLAVGWFDRFGIERIAVDRGILDGEDALEGVFVALLDGDSI